MVRGSPVCIIDTETTGLQSGFHELIEVAAIRIDRDTREAKTFYFRPMRPDRASDRALEVNGWSQDRWARLPHPQSPKGLEQYTDLIDMCQRCYIIGHNVGFDLEFLREHLRIHGMTRRAEKARSALSRPKIRGEIDTIGLTWLALGNRVDRLSLDHLRERFPQIAGGAPHTAMGDAQTLENLIRMIDPNALPPGEQPWIP